MQNSNNKKTPTWLFEISHERSKFKLNFKEIYQYRDLLMLFIRRDIVSVYKQTILGPLWFFIQPLFTSAIQFVVFSKIANISSGGVPYFLFVLAGNTLWSYFSISLTDISATFIKNQGIFGKVYFPRAIIPLSVTISNLFKFGIQFVLFIVVLIYVKITNGNVNPNLFALFLPMILLCMALISVGLGMVITSITTKYRDFTFILGFGMSLFMYVTPVVYPTSLAVEKLPSNWLWIVYSNPLTGLFDLFKYGFLGEGVLNWFSLIWSFVFAIFVFVFGLIVFNKTEKTFMDTI